ncbi:hypothetical protein GQ457_03G021080 [Hibiscus cannabinus]
MSFQDLEAGRPLASRQNLINVMQSVASGIFQINTADTLAKLKQASETDHRAGVSASKKVTYAKLAKDFQAVLKEFQKAQRLAAERETSYPLSVPQEVHPSSYTTDVVDLASDRSAEQQALLVESRSYLNRFWMCMNPP